jgi:hypothetical protein
MQNHKTKAIQRLRTTALDENEAPLERLRAAQRLLIDHGASDRNAPIINRVVKQYVSDADVSIAERAQKLKLKLANARGLKSEAAKVEIPEPELTATEESTGIVAGTSASEVPKPSLSISLNEVIDAHQQVLGCFRWRQFNEGIIDLSEEEKTQLLEANLGGSPTVENVRALFEAVHVPNGLGWTIGSSCPSIVRVAQDFLKQNGVTIEPPKLDEQTQSTLDRLNRRGEVSQ